jgi:hypothetical protein
MRKARGHYAMISRKSVFPELFQHIFNLVEDVHAQTEGFTIDKSQFFNGRSETGERKPGFFNRFFCIQPGFCTFVCSFWHGDKEEVR